MSEVLKGNCYYCGAELGKTAMKNHLLKEQGEREGCQECCLLKIEGAYNKNYWLYIDVPVEKTLSNVDAFLRKIWLECCGHLSEFTDTRHNTVGKSRRLSAFCTGDKLLHAYDFGSTTECLVTFVGTTYRKTQREIVRLLARNIPPQYECNSCKKLADFICVECTWNNEYPFFCKKCIKKHRHECILPVTNSPRMGECAYSGEMDVYDFDPKNLYLKKP